MASGLTERFFDLASVCVFVFAWAPVEWGWWGKERRRRSRVKTLYSHFVLFYIFFFVEPFFPLFLLWTILTHLWISFSFEPNILFLVQ